MTISTGDFFPEVGGLHTVSVYNLDRIREFCISYFEISDGIYSKEAFVTKSICSNVFFKILSHLYFLTGSLDLLYSSL